MMKTSQGPLVSLVIVSGLVLTCMTLAGLAPIVLLWQMNIPQGMSKLVVPDLSATDSNRLARDAFSSFDPVKSPLLGSASVGPTEFERFLKQLEEQSAPKDTIKFSIPVNKNETHKRILSVLGSRSLSMMEDISLQSQLISRIPPGYLNSLKFVRIDVPEENAKTRIVHAIGYSENGWESREWRFWFTRDDAGWQIFDWQRMDLGLTYSEQQCRHIARLIDGVYSIEADLVRLEEIIGTGDFDFAREVLSLIQSKPRYVLSLQDVDWVRIAYVYLAMGDYKEALACAQRVKDSEKCPGTHRVQQLALFHLNDFEGSIKQGNAYVSYVGNSPEVSLRMGLAFHALGRAADGDAALVAHFNFNSWEPSTLVRFIANEGESALPVVKALLDRHESPLQFATELPAYYSIRAQGDMVLEALVSFAESTAPTASETHYLKGEMAAWNDEHEAAYSQFKLAMDAAVEADHRNKYASAASRTLKLLGKIEEAYELEPSKSEMIESEYWARMNGDSTLTEAEWTQLSFRHLKNDPNDPLALDRVLEYLIANGDLEQAEKEIRQRFEFWRPSHGLPGLEDASSRSGEEGALEMAMEAVPEYENHNKLNDSIGTRFLQVMVLSGRFDTAYEEAVQRAERDVEWLDSMFSKLADFLIELKDWESLAVLLELHRQNRPNDPTVLMYQGQFAAHRQQWTDAIASYEAAIRTAPDQGRIYQLSQYLLHESLCESDMWLKYYRAAEDKSSLFYELERHMPEDEPEQLEQLIDEHLAAVAVDQDFAFWMADHKQGRLDEAGYLEWIYKAIKLSSDSESKRSEMNLFLENIARIHVRNGNDEMARRVIGDSELESTLIEALIDARQQKHGDAAAKLQNSKHKSMYFLSRSENLGWDAFRPEYLELQQQSPFRLASLHSSVQWVGYLREPIDLDLPRVATTAEALFGKEYTVTQVIHHAESDALAPTFLLETQTPAHAKWYVQVHTKSPLEPLGRTEFNREHVAADQSKAVIVIGRNLREISEWSASPASDPSNEFNKVLRLLEALSGENIAVWYDARLRTLVLPSADWKFQTAERASSVFRQQGVPGFRDSYHEAIIRSRQREFRGGLRKVLLAEDLTKLRVRKTQRIGFLEEPVWFTVQSVQKIPNDLEIRVSLATDLIFVPDIKAGLPCVVNLNELDAWQIEGQAIVKLATHDSR